MARDIGQLYDACAAGVGSYQRIRGERERFGPQRGGAASTISGLQRVLVKKDGGTGGTNTTQCTWTYGIWPVTGDITDTDQRLAAALTPVMPRRPTFGPCLQAPDGSSAIAEQVGETWLLLVCAEVEEVQLCTT